MGRECLETGSPAGVLAVIPISWVTSWPHLPEPWHLQLQCENRIPALLGCCEDHKQIACEERAQQRLACSRCWSPACCSRKSHSQVTSTRGFRLEELFDIICSTLSLYRWENRGLDRDSDMFKVTVQGNGRDRTRTHISWPSPPPSSAFSKTAVTSSAVEQPSKLQCK